MAPPEICTLEIIRGCNALGNWHTQAHISSLVINFLRNGKQTLRLTVESKSTWRACVWTTNQFVHKILKTAGQVSTCSTAVSLTALRSCSAFCWSIALWGDYHGPQRKAAPCEMEESGLQGRGGSLCGLSWQWHTARKRTWKIKQTRRGAAEPEAGRKSRTMPIRNLYIYPPASLRTFYRMGF